MSAVPASAVEACVASVVRADVQSTRAYHVGDATGLLKLDAMENPYGLPALVCQEVAQALAGATLNRYPAPDAVALESALRTATAIPAQAGVMFGNGSDELIHLLIQATCQPGDVVLSPVPTFVMYAVSAQWNHARFVGVDTLPDFSLDMPAMLSAIAQHKPKVVFLAYPNNPTGCAFGIEEIQTLIQAAAPGLVVIDEAYAPFASHSFMPHVLEAPNVVVVRTVSKQGLAGIRLGYVAGASAWISQFDKVRPPYNINVLTREVAAVILRHHAVLDTQAQHLCRDREKLGAALKNMADVLEVYPTHANFVLFRVSKPDEVFNGLKKQGILIRNVSAGHPLLAGCLRVTVSTPEENEQFLSALRKVMAK